LTHRNIETGFQIMNASEIASIEARLPVGLRAMPSPEQMQNLMGRIRRERSQHMAASFASFGGKVRQAILEVRKIAVACTAARLHQQPV
jgi:hypothetical protein